MSRHYVDSDNDEEELAARPPPTIQTLPRSGKTGPGGSGSVCSSNATYDDRRKHKNRPSQIERVDGEFEEYYDNAKLIEAITTLASTQGARTKRILELERYAKENPAVEEGPDDPHRLLLKRLRRVEGCQRWCEDLERVSHPPNKLGLRRRTVGYGRKSLKIAKCMWGRRYATCTAKIKLPTYRGPRSVALQGAPREVRLVICSPVYYDVDMVNSFIRIAIAKARTYGMDPPLKTLELYGSNDALRETMLRQIMEHHQIYDRDIAKRLPLQLLHGGSYKGWLKDERPPVWEPLPWVNDFSNDVSRLLVAMLERPDGIERAITQERPTIVRDKKRKSYSLHGGIAEADRTIFANIMQSYEDELLLIIIGAFQREGWTIGSLQFDGLYIEPREGVSVEETMRFAEEEVHRITKGEFDVSLKCKELYGESSDGAFTEWRTAHLANVGS